MADTRSYLSLIGSGNHSSEEELEEINTNKKSYVEREERDCKRKWIETDTSTSEEEFEDPELKLEVWNGGCSMHE